MVLRRLSWMVGSGAWLMPWYCCCGSGWRPGSIRRRSRRRPTTAGR
ncbi:hypothetical protein O0544_09875 [Edwardsiella anguillarum]|nr:hypothetical protein [Edwardsiella anguillarum]